MNQIDAMTADELRALRDRVDYELVRLGGSTRAQAKRAPFTAWEELVWQSVCEVMGFSYPLARFADQFGRVKFADAAAFLESYVRRACDGALIDRRRKALLLTRIFGCLADRLVDWHVPTTHSNLMKNVFKIGSAVESSFPGYAEAGLLIRIAVPALAAVD
jgi:hypothetical protein